MLGSIMVALTGTFFFGLVVGCIFGSAGKQEAELTKDFWQRRARIAEIAVEKLQGRDHVAH